MSQTIQKVHKNQENEYHSITSDSFRNDMLPKLMCTSNKELFSHMKRMVMRSFLYDCREAYVISNSYGMGDPLAPS